VANPSATADGTDLTPIVESDFSDLTALLSDALLASYLLGENQISEFIARGSSPTVREGSFAEPDDRKKKRQQDAGRSARTDAGAPDPIETRFDLPPAEAIDYFKAKKIVRKKEFNQLSREAQQGAFTVSGVYKDDVLRGFKDEIDAALKSGATQQATIKRFKDILGGAGHRELGEFHLETVFRTNMQTAYGTGRRRAMEEVVSDFPFWQYRTVGDDRVRPAHAALNGIILPANHSFWSTHYCPWDFNCRCSVTPTDEIPDGYDPKNPSGELDQYGEPVTQLSYDDQGMPAKAEIGTSLVDLQVGKFSGVARGASLLTTIEAGVTRAEESRR
jgi:SPP1 gp7 family putative phage head morphogenesis protein